MELTNKFKMAHYLMTNKDTFKKLLAAIEDYKSLPLDSTLGRNLNSMLMRKKSNTDVTYPETLISVMYSCLGREVAWSLLLSLLKKHDGDFRITDIEAHGLEGLVKYDKYRGSNLGSIVENTLENLNRADVNRVKLLLSWEIVTGYMYIPYGVIEKNDIYDLSDVIVSRHCGHAVYVMALILTQIEQMDLVVELISASTGRRKGTRVCPKPN